MLGPTQPYERRLLAQQGQRSHEHWQVSSQTSQEVRARATAEAVMEQGSHAWAHDWLEQLHVEQVRREGVGVARMLQVHAVVLQPQAQGGALPLTDNLLRYDPSPDICGSAS